MKTKILFVLALLSCNLLLAQDIIIKKNGEEIRSKVIEITQTVIKYKEYDFTEGPLRNIPISDVFMIIYETGRRESFAKKQDTKPTVPPTEFADRRSANEHLISTEERHSFSNQSFNDYKGKYFMLGTGYGNSYGGAGVRLQWRSGGNLGFGFHFGAGYFPEAPVLASVGIKFFPYKGFYLNTQYGLTGYEYNSYYYHSSSYNFYESDEQLLHGPSFMVGGDWVWGTTIGYGFNAALGITYNVNAWYLNVTPAIDIGFVIRF